jgi:hypothetical protein
VRRRGAAGALALAVLAASAHSGPARAAGPGIGARLRPTASEHPVDGCRSTPPDDYVVSIGADLPLKADFGAGLYEGAPSGIPYVVVPPDQAMVEIRFFPFGDETEAYPDESDPGPYPVPADAPIEGGSDSADDRHVLVVQERSCTLFELYKAAPNADGSWNAMGSVRFDLESNELRIEGWTSADAAGLPIFLGWCATTRWPRRDTPRLRLPRRALPGLCLAGPALRFLVRGPGAAADGPAVPAESQRRHRALLGRKPGHPPRAPDLWHDPRRQRLAVVRQRSAGRRLGQRCAQRRAPPARRLDFEAVDVSPLMRSPTRAGRGRAPR